MSHVTRQHGDHGRDIRTCMERFRGDEERLNCLRNNHHASPNQRHGSGYSAPSPRSATNQNQPNETHFSNACKDMFFSPTEQSQCVSLFRNKRIRAKPLFSSCDQSFMSDKDELECLRLSVSSRHYPPALVESCDNVFITDDNTINCIRATTQALMDPTSIILECEKMVGTDRYEIECIEIATRKSTNQSQIIRTCKDRFNSDKDRINCLKHDNNLQNLPDSF